MAKNSPNDIAPATEMMESPEDTSRGDKNKQEKKESYEMPEPVTENILYIYFLQEITFKLSRLEFMIIPCAEMSRKVFRYYLGMVSRCVL